MAFRRHVAILLAIVTVLSLFTVFPVIKTVSAATTLSSSTYYVDNTNKLIFEVPCGVTVRDFISAFAGVEEFEVTDSKGNEKSNSSKLVNGDILLADEVEYTVIIKGDVNGDGTVNSSDILTLTAHVTASSRLSGVSLLAADVDYDGVVNSTDILSAKGHVVTISNLYDINHPDRHPNDSSSVVSTPDSSEESDTVYYTITFNAGDHGKLIGGTSATVEEGASFDGVYVPTINADYGYVFKGWSSEFPSTVTSNCSFTAIYEKDADLWHTVTFVSDDNGSITGTTVFTDILNGTVFDDAVSVPNVTAKAGYKFNGWTPELPDTVTEDATYKATFVVDDSQYATVTFVAGANGSFNGDSATVTQTVLKGTAWNEIAVPSYIADTGYKFNGWTPSFPETVNEDVTYTATFVSDDSQYATVTFIAGANGKLNNDSATVSQTVLKGTAWGEISVPSYTADAGYMFNGWTPSFPDTVSESVTFTANFIIDDSQFATVTFKAGENGSIVGTASFTVLKGTAWSEITVPTYSANTGYKFSEWSPAFPNTITANAEYTALFVYDASQYATVTFNKGTNGTLTGAASFTVLKGTAWSEITVPNVTPNDGYTFSGWTPTFPNTITADATYTAQYTAIPTYSVVFAAGTNGSLDGTWYYDNIRTGTKWSDAVIVPTPVANEGYEFDSWSPVLPSATDTIASNLEFTALFKVKEVVSSRVNYASAVNGGSYAVHVGTKLNMNYDPDFTVSSTESYYNFGVGNVSLEFGSGFLNNDEIMLEDSGNWVELSRGTYTEGWNSSRSNCIVLVYKLSEKKDDVEQILINCGLMADSTNRSLPANVTVKYSTSSKFQRSMSWKTFGEASSFDFAGSYGYTCTIDGSVSSGAKYFQFIFDMTDAASAFVGRFGEIKILGPETQTVNRTVNFVAGNNGTLSGTTSFTVANGTAWSAIKVPTPTPAAGYSFSGWSPELPADSSKISANATYTAQFVKAAEVSINHALSSNGGQYYLSTGLLYGIEYSNNSFLDSFTCTDGYGKGYLNDGTYLTATGDNWVEVIYDNEKIELIFKLSNAIDVNKIVAHVGLRSGSTNRVLPDSIEVYGGETEGSINTLLGSITSFDQASDYGYIGSLKPSATNITYVKFVMSSAQYISRLGEFEVWGTVTNKVPTYNITFNTGANGTISGDASFTVEEGAVWGDFAVPTPVANAGYKFTGWTPVLPSNGDAITADATYTANFEFDSTQWSTLTFKAGSNGSLTGTASVTVLTGSSWSSVTVPTPVANSGYSFTGWSPSFPSTVTADATFTANFEETPVEYFTVTFVAGSGGTLSGTTSYTVESGTAWSAITVPTPVANSGYSFSGWSASFPSKITANATYTANFTKDIVYYTITFKAGSGGTLSGTTSYTIAEGTPWSSISVPTPVANTGYTFTGWSASFPSAVTANATYTANFAAVYYTITFKAGTGGKLTGTTSYTVLDGTAWSKITVPTPVANSGYKFSSWSSSFPSTITGDATFTANFEAIPTYTIKFVASNGGSISGTSSYTVYEGALWSTINVPTPVADDGYQFMSWSPSLPATSYAINEDITFTAQFAAQSTMTLEGVITLNGVNAGQYVSGGSHLYTPSYASAFAATYWDVFVAEYSEEKGGYIVTNVYATSTSKSVYVPSNGIIVAVHMGAENQAACSYVDVGDVLVLSSDIDVDNNSIVSGTSYVSIYTGDGTIPDQGEPTDPNPDPNPNPNPGTKINYTNVKAMWLSQFDLNGVFTSGTSQRAESSFRSLMSTILNNCVDMGFNTIIVQVRPNGDSMYPSEYYPMSKYVVGSYGKDATYDPFAIIIEMAHELNLSVQAWINPLRLMTSSEITKISTSYKIGEWYNSSTYKGDYVVLYSSNYYLNPAYEEVRNLIINGAKEICLKYNVDGVHMDDYFYPTTAASFDQKSYNAMANGATLANWRRANLNKLVSGIYSAVKSVSSDILFGISPAGNLSTVYNSQYADVYTWCSTAGYIDYICPQVYFGMLHATQSVPTCSGNWANIVKHANVTLYIGLTLGKAVDGYNGSIDTYAGSSGQYEWVNNRDVIKDSLVYIRDNVSKCTGIAFFCYQYFYSPTTGAARAETAEERTNFLPIFQAMWN